MFEMIALAAFAGLVVYAACSDIARLIIPNWVSIALAAIFPVAALITGAPLMGVGLHILSQDASFDEDIPVLLVAIAGGLMALARLTARQLLPVGTYPSFVDHLLKKQNGIPYGVAIMVGALMAIPSLPYLSSPLTLP